MYLSTIPFIYYQHDPYLYHFRAQEEKIQKSKNFKKYDK